MKPEINEQKVENLQYDVEVGYKKRDNLRSIFSFAFESGRLCVIHIVTPTLGQKRVIQLRLIVSTKKGFDSLKSAPSDRAMHFIYSDNMTCFPHFHQQRIHQ